MSKLIKINGMSCGHCVAAVTSALEEIGASNIKVDLDAGLVSFDGEIENETIKNAIEEEGFDVISIE